MGLEIVNSQTQQVNDVLRAFVRQVMKDAGLANADGSYDESYVDRLREQLEKRIGLMVMQELKPAALDAYAKIIYEEKPTPERLATFLQENIVDFQIKQRDVFDQFAKGVIESSKAMKKALA
ncbi:MAG: hypothetical protein Q7S16_04725 [bacterium]|nr:hypothetical protein [bacterium]